MEQVQLPALPMHQVRSTRRVPWQLCQVGVGLEREVLLREQTWRACYNTGKIICNHSFLLLIVDIKYSPKFLTFQAHLQPWMCHSFPEVPH